MMRYRSHELDPSPPPNTVKSTVKAGNEAVLKNTLQAKLAEFTSISFLSKKTFKGLRHEIEFKYLDKIEQF